MAHCFGVEDSMWPVLYVLLPAAAAACCCRVRWLVWHTALWMLRECGWCWLYVSKCLLLLLLLLPAAV
jgi:hypothetical protein